MSCQACGARTATKHVRFHQNIGLLIVRLPKRVEGHLCKSCIHKYFWECTAITLFFGWWGLISLCVTPFILINNVIYYVSCLGMPSSPIRESTDQGEEPEIVSRTSEKDDGKDACYLCGKRLQPDECEARVCRACRV
jgi:hypothetical protein